MPTRLPNGATQMTVSEVQALQDTPEIHDARAAYITFMQQHTPYEIAANPALLRQKQGLFSDLSDAVSTATAGTPYAIVEPSSIVKDFLLPAALIVGGGLAGGEFGGMFGSASGDLAPGLIDTATAGAGSAIGSGAGEGLQTLLNNPSDSYTTQSSQARQQTVPGGGSTSSGYGIQGPGSAVGDALDISGGSSSLIPGISNNTLALGGLGVIGRAFTPPPYPPRVSYVGTSADPIQFMTELHGKLNDLYNHATSMLNAPPPTFPSVPPLGTGQFAPAPPRARGGPVRAGHAYTVGELGPEQFTPQHSGTITPTRRPLRMPMPMPVGRGQTPAAAMAAPGGGGSDAVQGKAAAMLLLHALSGA